MMSSTQSARVNGRPQPPMSSTTSSGPSRSRIVRTLASSTGRQAIPALAGSPPVDHAEHARTVVAAQPFWYHTIEVHPGVVTPGWFDLRLIVDRLPWPDVRGKR